MSDILITAKELGEELIKYGHLPIKICFEMGDNEERICTLLTRDDYLIASKGGQQSDYGDIDLCRVLINHKDNA